MTIKVLKLVPCLEPLKKVINPRMLFTILSNTKSLSKHQNIYFCLQS